MKLAVAACKSSRETRQGKTFHSHLRHPQPLRRSPISQKVKPPLSFLKLTQVERSKERDRPLATYQNPGG
ncbi:hypothetical protein [Microcoleus sp. OTE_8_concoct_300]|uniref:hypothetical protein n=1 Tax=Microcoleus sp. OTE_8_concoct_300 TaxID=2964710 RepID=UPI00403F16A3